jgi:hypothetical protein
MEFVPAPDAKPPVAVCQACLRLIVPAASFVLSPVCDACVARAGEQPQPVPGLLLLKELGRGGMGVVYLALRPADGSLAALKTIKPAGTASRTDVDRFLREAAILRQLHHPHIVRFHEMGSAADLLYFTMEYVPGTDAKQLLRARGPFAVGEAVRLVCQVLTALGTHTTRASSTATSSRPTCS